MKKIFVLVLSTVLSVFALCSCQSEKPFEFTSDYLKVTDSENEIVITQNTHLEIGDGEVKIRQFGEFEQAVTQGNYKIAGVGIGDDYSALADAFRLQENYAMWETVLYVNERENVYNYPAYEEKAIDFSAYDDNFLTVGFYTDSEGKWNTMDAATLKAVWNLEVDDIQREKIIDICIISAGLDEKGIINAMFLDYGSYDVFAEKENYEVNVDFFAQAPVEDTEQTEQTQEDEQPEEQTEEQTEEQAISEE